MPNHFSALSLKMKIEMFCQLYSMFRALAFHPPVLQISFTFDSNEGITLSYEELLACSYIITWNHFTLNMYTNGISKSFRLLEKQAFYELSTFDSPLIVRASNPPTHAPASSLRDCVLCFGFVLVCALLVIILLYHNI
jgi:hypothetical protein